MTINKLFRLGMKRFLPNFQEWDDENGLSLEIGPGFITIPNTKPLGLPDYDANFHLIPYDDLSIDTIHCYHVIEHLHQPLFFLSECSRVLKSGGLLNIVVPHHLGSMSYQDISHERHFSVEVFHTMLSRRYYNAKYEYEIDFDVVGSIIIGLVEKNLCIISQLRKK